MMDPFFKTLVSLETGVPPFLLTGNDVRTCRAQAKEICDFMDNGPQIDRPRYPVLNDGGTPLDLPDGRSTREQFAEFAGEALAWDPKVGPGGWRRIL